MALSLLDATTGANVSSDDYNANNTVIESWASAQESAIAALEAKTFGYALTVTVLDDDTINYVVVPFSGTIERAYCFVQDVGTATGNIIFQDGGTNGSGTTAITTFTTTTTGTGNEKLSATGLSHTVSAGDVLRVNATGLTNAADNDATITVTAWIALDLI